MVYAQTRIHHKRMRCIKLNYIYAHKTLWEIQLRRLKLILIKNKKRTNHQMDFTVHRVKIKESIKIDKYLNLTRELKKLWNVRLMVIPVIVGALGMVIKVFEGLEELEIRGKKKETIQTIALLRSARNEAY